MEGEARLDLQDCCLPSEVLVPPLAPTGLGAGLSLTSRLCRPGAGLLLAAPRFTRLVLCLVPHVVVALQSKTNSQDSVHLFLGQES